MQIVLVYLFRNLGAIHGKNMLHRLKLQKLQKIAKTCF